jgi:hypothetical protein
MKPKLSVEVVVTNYYMVTDCYNYTRRFEHYKEAVRFLKNQREEQKVISMLKPKGATLILSNNRYVYYGVIPAFIGFNGVPFCECNKDKTRPLFYNHNNTIERYSTVYGSLIDVLKRVYELLDGVQSFDRWDGAYHYSWDTEVGNSHCIYPATLGSIWNDSYWYNWDGENFTTNDPDCLVTSSDFK